MGNLPVQQARALFTKVMIAAYDEIVPVPSFLRSFFTVKTTEAATIAIDVRRGTERIAVDVLRGTKGNRNTRSLSTEKNYLPPFYDENFDQTALDRYDRVFGMDGNAIPRTIGYLGKDTAVMLGLLRDKIERAKELQASQVFNTGVVTMINGDDIDFKRKATSMVDLTGAGGYWDTTTTDIEDQLIAGAEFNRQVGKNGTPVFNLVMSGSAWVNFKKNDFFTTNATYNQVSLLDINMPQAQSFGAAYHGQIAAGAYIVNLWTYDEVYEAAEGGAITKYLPTNIAFMVPVKGTEFIMSHAGVPAIIRDVSNAEFSEWIQNVAAEYYINNYIDPQAKAHIFEIMSAFVGVPVTVDMIYTMQVLA